MHSKIETLLIEANEDFKFKFYNKCVSAAYFASRMAVERYLRSLRIFIPRRDDKLANAIENLGFKNEASLLRILYELRKKADYTDENITENEATQALKMANLIIERFRINNRLS
ncbi:MAG: HEPN domain-containing protein [Thermoprotei archaeon]|jgi:uncharacterized protein (UPF0332 family)